MSAINFYFLLCLVLLSGCLCAQPEYTIRDLKKGRFQDDSSYIYNLPYEKGKSFFLVQGYHSKLSHKGEIALDFKMKRGTKVCAIREGIVQEIKEDSDKGGLKSQYFSEGNYILVRHGDHSFAWYFHLQRNGAFVQPGDTVKPGQVVGLSGNSGYSAFPHLHIEVVVRNSGRYQQLPIRFRLRNGVHYLKPFRFYRNGKK
jgi:murein DD-endopeptidase MepM/ murein hydrolase activator NlpD